MNMGQVNTHIRVTNWFDLEKVASGERGEPPRAAEAEALVDTGAVRFYLRASLVKQLGLRPIRKITSRTMADVSVERTVYSPVDLEIQGRSSTFEVVEVPDSLPNIVGQIPLEQLDWVVDPRGQKLIPNPEHKHGEMCDDF
ncbi:MAG: clan AA aspartic protease [Verrucomicrobia bacterium]|nr:clan AA aspartic protease [Verrucomicrobiota bacterium]